MHVRVAAPAAESRDRARPRPHRELLPLGLFALYILLVGAFLVHEGRGSTFFFDEWSIWGNRHGAAVEKWLGPVNGHLSAVPILAYTTITAVFGAEDLLPYRVAGVLAHLTVLVLIFLAARPRLGSWAALIALAPVGVVAAGSLVFLMPIAALFAIGPFIGGLAAYLLLRRGTRAGDAGAMVMLLLGVACGGMGVGVMAAAVVTMLLDRRLRRRSWVAVVPLALYLVWRQAYSVPSELAFWDTAFVAPYVARGFASGLSAYWSLPETWGPPLAVAFALLAGWAATRWPPHRTALVGILLTAGAFWALIAFARAPDLGPEEVRYVYGSAFLVALIALVVMPRIDAPLGVWLMATAVAALLLMAQMSSYRTKAAEYRQNSQFTMADLFAFRTLDGIVAPEFTAPSGDPQASAGMYLNARRFWTGPPGLSETEVLAAPAPIRDHVDTTLAQGARLAVAPVPDPGAVERVALPEPAGVAGAAVNRRGDCWTVSPPAAGGAPAAADVEVAAAQGGGLLVRAGDAKAEVAAGRYFEEPIEALGSVPAGGAGAVTIPPDRARTPWRLRVSSESAVRVCGAAAP